MLTDAPCCVSKRGQCSLAFLERARLRPVDLGFAAELSSSPRIFQEAQKRRERSYNVAAKWARHLPAMTEKWLQLFVFRVHVEQGFGMSSKCRVVC